MWTARKFYARLVRLFPKSYYERFGEGMVQTFNDLLRERQQRGERIFLFLLGTFIETTVALAGENAKAAVQHRRFMGIMAAMACLLLVPAIAQLTTDEVKWTAFDFFIAGNLLFGAGIAFELLARRAGSFAYKAGSAMAVGVAAQIVWINLAVGFIGDEGNPANLMYGGVLAVGFVGAISARFRPRGMARALFATAFAHALVAVIALALAPPMVLFANAVFVILWTGAGLLFQSAAAPGEGLEKEIRG